MTTEKRRSFIINFLYFLIIAAIAYFLVQYCLGTLAPFILALLVAALLDRPIRFLTRVLPLKRRPVAVLTTAVFFIGIAGLITLLGSSAFRGLRDLIALLPDFYTDQLEPALLAALQTVEELIFQVNESSIPMFEGWENQILQPLSELVVNISKGAVGLLSGTVTSLPGFIIKFILFIISSFFLAMDYPHLIGFCMAQVSEKTRNILTQVKRYVVGTLFVCLRSYIIIMFITFTELSIALSIIRVDNAVLIAALIAVFDILPVLGTGGIMIPWAVISVFWGHYGRALALAVIYLIITFIRNVIEPKIVGGQLGLHPVVTLTSMFVGAQLFGVLGLFGFPIGLSLLCYLNNNGTISIFKAPPEEGAATPPPGGKAEG